jgi:hypothetical protein
LTHYETIDPAKAGGHIHKDTFDVDTPADIDLDCDGIAAVLIDLLEDSFRSMWTRGIIDANHEAVAGESKGDRAQFPVVISQRWRPWILYPGVLQSKRGFFSHGRKVVRTIRLHRETDGSEIFK